MDTPPESVGQIGDDSDEFQDVEITELDGALLRDLLEEAKEEEAGGSRAGMEQSLALKSGSSGCISTPEGQWPEMVELEHPTFPMEKATIAWYVEDMAEFGCIGSDSLFYTEDSSDEMTYSYLWQD